MSDSDKIILTSSDGERFEVNEAVAHEFKMVAHKLEDVHSRTLVKVLEYCKKHVELEENNEEAKKKLKDWDEELINVDMNTLMELIIAAYNLNVKGLVDIGCQKVADAISDIQQPEELGHLVRDVFKLDDHDYTAEELAAVRTVGFSLIFGTKADDHLDNGLVKCSLSMTIDLTTFSFSLFP